jgi:hypothetical protein
MRASTATLPVPELTRQQLWALRHVGAGTTPRSGFDPCGNDALADAFSCIATFELVDLRLVFFRDTHHVLSLLGRKALELYQNADDEAPEV